MKKTNLLHSRISGLIAELGHGDSICIADAGLPVPPGVERIDLAVCPGLPGLNDCLVAICGEMTVETVLTASELDRKQPLALAMFTFLDRLGDDQGKPIHQQQLSHEAFKAATATCKAVIRTGECTPFANIILTAGVAF